MPDGAYACPTETAKAAEHLRALVDMVPAARDIAHGLSRRGGGGASGKPGSRLPLDLMATEKLDAVQATLTRWVDYIGATRGHMRPWFAFKGDPIVIAAQWLPGNLEWMRHQPDREPDDEGHTWGADDFLTDIEACARVVAGIARGPSDQRFLGPCGAAEQVVTPFGHPPGSQTVDGARCDGDVYAREGAQHGRCRTCGAEWSTAERRAWLDAEVRSHAYTAAEIAEAYPIKANTIRQWLSRGLLVPHGELDGRPLLNLGEVLDLAAGDAARREEARATRARRAAVKAEEASDAA
jgi:hypothetical protein